MDPKQEQEAGKTAFVSRSIFPGDKELKPGSTCKIKVVAVYEDDVEVEYVSEEKKGESYETQSMDQKLDDAAASNGNSLMM